MSSQFKCLGVLLFMCLLSSQVEAFEHPSYQITATVDLDDKTIVAQQKVTFTNNTSAPTDNIFFHIYPHRKYTAAERSLMLRYAAYFKVDPPEGFQSGDLQIHSVKRGDQDINFVIEGEDQTILRIPLSSPLRPGASITLNLDYTVEIPHAYGRFGWHQNITQLSRWYPILSVLNKKGWNNYPFYPFHRPFFSDASNYSVNLTVPGDQVVIHSGQLIADNIESNDVKTLYVESEYPIREFSLAMSSDYQLQTRKLDDITIKSYYLPGREYHAKKALESAHDMMSYYTERFGSYPYKEFSIAPVHLGYGGEQMSNLIFIDTRVYGLPKMLNRYFDFLIAHETGHQWLYNLVGIDEYQHIWLEEGVDSYFLMEYLEDKYGYDAEIAEFPEWSKNYEWLLPKLTFRNTRGFRYKMLTRIGFDHPIISELSSFQEPSTIFSLAYGKGTFVVGMLKEQIGEEAFNKVFKRIFEEYRHQNLDIQDFIRLCEEESGKDLTSFFDQWLFTNKRLDYAVKGVKGSDIILENREGIQMPVDILVKFKGGMAYHFWWDGSEKEHVHKTGVDDSIRSVTIDPNNKYLDIDRTNNHWPRIVELHPVPVYIPLYELPIFLPENSYNLVFGPAVVDSALGIKASLQKPYDQIFYASTGYELGESLHKSKAGYQINNLLGSQMAAGFEIANRADHDDGSEDLVSGKVFLRRELWPVQYGLGAINDHISFYMIRNKGLDGTLNLGGEEDGRNVSYLKRDEAIAGARLHFGRAGTYPDPREGYNLDLFYENSGHFMGASQHFHRSAFDLSVYRPVTKKSKLAFRMKYGWGFPDDKRLFQLGGIDGLRGYKRKSQRGSSVFLGSVEYRFPIIEDINMPFFDNIFGLESIGGVVFFDAGHSWFDEFGDSSLKKDAGFGLRIQMSVGSYLEKVIIRADVAQAINESGEEPRFWFGAGHAF